MLTLLMTICLFVLIFVGFPIAFCMVVSVGFYLLVKGNTSLLMLPQQMYVAVNSFPISAVPFFLLSGDVMFKCGMTGRLVRFSELLVGWCRGGLALVNIVANMFFAGVSGSAIADCTALGSLMIPAMEEQGYDRDFSAAVTAAASIIGPIIPPSIPMVILGVTLGLPIGTLFLAGVLPGIMLGFGLMIGAYVISRKRKYKKANIKEILTIKEIVERTKDAVLVIVMPLIVVGGIVGGFFTPTEAGAVAAGYSLLVAFTAFRKDFGISDLIDSLESTAIITASVWIIIAAANPFGWVVSIEQIPLHVSHSILSLTQNPVFVMLIIVGILLFVGMFMETIAIILILGPVLYVAAMQVNVDPIYFGLIFVLGTVIGLLTPPLGMCVFVAVRIGNVPLEKVIKEVFPFILIEIVVLVVLVCFPEITLLVPKLVGVY